MQKQIEDSLYKDDNDKSTTLTQHMKSSKRYTNIDKENQSTTTSTINNSSTISTKYSKITQMLTSDRFEKVESRLQTLTALKSTGIDNNTYAMINTRPMSN